MLKTNKLERLSHERLFKLVSYFSERLGSYFYSGALLVTQQWPYTQILGLNKLYKHKHSSLIDHITCDKEKSFVTLTSGVDVLTFSVFITSEFFWLVPHFLL